MEGGTKFIYQIVYLMANSGKEVKAVLMMRLKFKKIYIYAAYRVNWHSWLVYLMA